MISTLLRRFVPSQWTMHEFACSSFSKLVLVKKTFQMTIKLMYMKVNLQAVHIFSWTANETYEDSFRHRSKKQLGNGSFKRFVPALRTIKMDYPGIYKIPKAPSTHEANCCSLLINTFFFSVMFIRPSSLLPSVDVSAGQTSRVSLCLRPGNFSAPHGMPGLSCRYPACQLHKSLTCQPVIHSLTHWNRNWGGRTTRRNRLSSRECEYSEHVAKQHGTWWWRTPHVIVQSAWIGLWRLLISRRLNKLVLCTIRNKLCWDANNAVGLSNQRKLALNW